MPLDDKSPEVLEFLNAWHENGRAAFEANYENLDYDSPSYAKFAKLRKKYIALDRGSSGEFLVDRLTHRVFSIKAYGVPNRFVGTIESLTARYLDNTAMRRTVGSPGYVYTDAYLLNGGKTE